MNESLSFNQICTLRGGRLTLDKGIFPRRAVPGGIATINPIRGTWNNNAKTISPKMVPSVHPNNLDD